MSCLSVLTDVADVAFGFSEQEGYLCFLETDIGLATFSNIDSKTDANEESGSLVDVSVGGDLTLSAFFSPSYLEICT